MTLASHIMSIISMITFNVIRIIENICTIKR